MHKHLARQLRRLGLSGSDPPSEATIAVRASVCVAESARTGAM